MKIKTRVFDLAEGKYKSLAELSRAMGISVSQLYRVREGKRPINEKFVIGAMKALPKYKLNELFYLEPVEKAKVWYDSEADFLEVIFEQKEGYFRETNSAQVMQKVDMQGNIIGFSVLNASSVKGKILDVDLVSASK